MKKKLLIIILAVAIIGISLNANVFITQKFIKAHTYTEIENTGYTINNIAEIKIDHSYLRKILGYNEWRISVEFKKVPNVFFWFTYRNKKIVFQGVSSQPMLDKDFVIEYSEKFKNGMLLRD